MSTLFDQAVTQIADYNYDFDYDSYPEASDIMIAEDFLVSGECNSFAVILNDLTNLPIKIFIFQNEWGFGHHAVVQLHDNEYLDAKGKFSANEISARYGYNSMDTQIKDPECSPFFSYDEDKVLDELISSYIQNHPTLKPHIHSKPLKSPDIAL